MYLLLVFTCCYFQVHLGTAAGGEADKEAAEESGETDQSVGLVSDRVFC